MSHIPVLPAETIEALNLRPGLVIADCTLGGGGHAASIAERIGASGQIYAFDRDPRAREYAAAALQSANIELIPRNFCELTAELRKRGVTELDGALFDLGVSSFQLDDPERGFSFQTDCPLDMRMDPAQPLTAARVVNQYRETELADIIYRYGEEHRARRIARQICACRTKHPLQTSGQLKTIILRAAPGSYASRTTTLARVFQALRIEVNTELDILAGALRDAATLLKPGGRLAVIAFHSLEDRIVKNTMRELAQANLLTLVNKKPLTAGAAELQNNPRARSAKLRIGQKNGG